MSKKQNKKTGIRSRHPVLAVTTALALVFALAAAGFVWYLMLRYDEGLLDVCATQQDGYVQLVLDQINLKDNRDSEEIITDILGTLDASSNKYWTFSKDQAMLFVKDVLETNKYKGFTTATYYVSDSAKAFLEDLRSDRVIHREIEVDGRQYVASGVTFQYAGEAYRLCLLTNRSVLLDNNVFLGAKVDLLTTVIVILLMLIVIPMIFASRVRSLDLAADRQEASLLELNSRLEQLNKKLSEHDLHDTRFNLWREDSAGEFLEKLSQRRVAPVCVIEVNCDSAADRETLLVNAHYSLDRQALRFEYGQHDLLLVFVQVGEDAAVLSLLPLLSKTCRMGQKYVAETPDAFDPEAVRQLYGLRLEESAAPATATQEG